MTRVRRIGVEFNPHIIGGTEYFLRALFSHFDRSRFVPVAIASSEGTWQSFLEGVAETRVVPYLDAAGSPADVAGGLRGISLDVMQSSYFSPVIALAAAQAGIPHVWRMGGHVDALEREWTEHDKARLLAMVQFTSKRVICGSRFLRSQFDRVGGERVEVIYNGIDLTALPAPVSRKRADGLSVAMVAHLVPQKRHAVFLRAAARVAAEVAGVRFFIFGGSYRTPERYEYEESIRALAAELGLEPLLEIRELRGDRFDTLKHIDIVTLPGVHEGASNAIVEAMALRVPVVAASSGGNAELVDDGVTGILVPANDPEALARALVELLRDRARREAMGDAGRERVEREFDIVECARRYGMLYEEVTREQAT